MPDLSLLTLTFRLRAEASAVLPPFLGSTLRGALGKALKQVLCPASHGAGEKCWLGEACAYQYVFESPNVSNVPREEMHPKLRGQVKVPPPFVLIPPGLKKKQFSPDSVNNAYIKNLNDDYCPQPFSPSDSIEFSIVLIGRAVHHWISIVAAARLLAENGLGEFNTRFTLLDAFAHDSSGSLLQIFSQDKQGVSTNGVAAAKLSELVCPRAQMLEAELQKEKALV